MLSEKRFQLIWRCKNTSGIVVHIVTADDLAPFGASTSVGEVVKHFVAFNTLRPRQNGRHFPDDIFKWIFLNENVWISINISLKFVPRGPINNIPTVVQVMAWRRSGDKPLSEPMMVNLSTHICVTRPQWVNYTGLHSLGNDWYSLKVVASYVYSFLGRRSRTRLAFTLGCLKYYLTNRTQFVNHDGINSYKLSVTPGVPQGSILAQTLSTIYMNNIPNTSVKCHGISCVENTNIHGVKWKMPCYNRD